MNEEHAAQIPLVERIKALRTCVLKEIVQIDGEIIERLKLYKKRLKNVNKYLDKLEAIEE